MDYESLSQSNMIELGLFVLGVRRGLDQSNQLWTTLTELMDPMDFQLRYMKEERREKSLDDESWVKFLEDVKEQSRKFPYAQRLKLTLHLLHKYHRQMNHGKLAKFRVQKRVLELRLLLIRKEIERYGTRLGAESSDFFREGTPPSGTNPNQPPQMQELPLMDGITGGPEVRYVRVEERQPVSDRDRGPDLDPAQDIRPALL